MVIVAELYDVAVWLWQSLMVDMALVVLYWSQRKNKLNIYSLCANPKENTKLSTGSDH